MIVHSSPRVVPGRAGYVSARAAAAMGKVRATVALLDRLHRSELWWESPGACRAMLVMAGLAPGRGAHDSRAARGRERGAPCS